MLGERYVVKKGDSLWRIAERKLGEGVQWPRIWKYNNRSEVIRETRRGIPNPDLIHIGQTLLIPRLPGLPSMRTNKTLAGVQQLPVAMDPVNVQVPPPPVLHIASAARSPARQPTLAERLEVERSPLAFKYRLDDLRWPPQNLGTAIIEIKMTGDVLLMTKQTYPMLYVTSRKEIELQATQAANHAFGELMRDTRYMYDVREKRITLRSMLVSRSDNPNLVATAIGVEMNSNSPVPKLRAEIRLPKLGGSIGQFGTT